MGTETISAVDIGAEDMLASRHADVILALAGLTQTGEPLPRSRHDRCAGRRKAKFQQALDQGVRTVSFEVLDRRSRGVLMG